MTMTMTMTNYGDPQIHTKSFHILEECQPLWLLFVTFTEIVSQLSSGNLDIWMEQFNTFL
jgi:hypothetical protein